MATAITVKVEYLKEILKKLDRIIVAFSGGVDSAVLLQIASDILPKEDIMAVTAVSPTYTAEERLEAEKLAKVFGVKHLLVETKEFMDKTFISNPPERCYYCKSELFGQLEEIRKKHRFSHIVDGTNKDDEKDFRPGEKAKQLYNVRSPLKEAGITKDEIRGYAKKRKLYFWNTPAMACLASRIPYGEKITLNKLRRISQGEKYLKTLGFREVRLRDYGNLARIEVGRDKMEHAIKVRQGISREMKKLGYLYVTLDLEGFSSGSMNRVLENAAPQNSRRHVK